MIDQLYHSNIVDFPFLDFIIIQMTRASPNKKEIKFKK